MPPLVTHDEISDMTNAVWRNLTARYPMDKITKSENREKRRMNRRKMIVRGRSIFTIVRIKHEKSRYKPQAKQFDRA